MRRALLILLSASIVCADDPGLPVRWEPRCVIDPPQFEKLDGICLADDELYVTDKDAVAVWVLDRDGKVIRSIPGRDRDLVRFERPVGIACRKGELIVADATGRRMVVMSPEGDVLRVVEAPAEHPFTEPQGLALGPDGDVWLVDTDGGRVYRFGPDGGYLGSFGAPEGESALVDAESIAVGPEGLLFVSDEGHFRVSVFDPAGDLVRTVGGQGAGAGRFEGDPEGLCIDIRGWLLVLDEDEGVLEVFDGQGRSLGRVGNGAGSERGQLESPDGIFYERDQDRVWIADQGNRRVQCFDLEAPAKALSRRSR